MRDKKTLFLFCSTRAFTADFLNTKYIRYLSEKFNVVVFLSYGESPNEVDTSGYYKNDSITYIPIRAPKGKFWTLFDVLLRNELIHKFDDNTAVRWRNNRALTHKRRMFIRKVSRFLPTFIFTPDLFTWIEQWFVPNYSEFKKYTKKYKPEMVLMASVGLLPLDTYAILCAKRAGIKSAAVHFSWDNITSYPRHVRKTNYLICWNNFLKNVAINVHGYKPEQVFVSGSIRFDHYFVESEAEKNITRELFIKNKGLDPKRKTIFFPSRTHGTFYQELIRNLIHWQKEDKFAEKVNLLVRTHPLDVMEGYEEFKGELNVCIERPGTIKQDDAIKGQKTEMNKDDFLNMKLLLKYSDVCINIGSTVSTEALSFDTPVVNFGFVPMFSDVIYFPHYQPMNENGANKIAKSMDDVLACINHYLEDPSLDREGRKKAFQELIYPTDGYSYKRNVDFIHRVLSK